MTVCINLIYLQILCIYSLIRCTRDHTDSDMWIKKTHRCDKKKTNTIFRINILEKHKIKLYKSQCDLHTFHSRTKKITEPDDETFADRRDISIAQRYNNRVI